MVLAWHLVTVLQAHAPLVPRVHAPFAPRTRPVKLSSAEKASQWSTDADWALTDAVPQFTVGQGSEVATFWTALAASTPELSSRSVEECEARLRELGSSEVTGPQPAVLEDWTRLPDGRYTGRLKGEPSFVWITVSTEGRLASDPRAGPGYIEAVGGRIYELSRAAAPSSPAPVAEDGGSPADKARLLVAQQGAFAQQAAAALGAALLAGGIGFGIGQSMAPPPPPPPMPRVTRVVVRSDRTVTRTADGDRISTVTTRSTEGGDRIVTTRALPPAAPLTISEQRERAELRVDRDKLKVANLEQRLKEDEQRLGEIKRLEGERGGDSEAVRLIFPPK